MRFNASYNLRSAYRADVDGLRAIAVIAVVLYHTGISGFGGGFVGVDVFFVISGFLITNLVVSGINAGTFRLSEFYERRARRLTPALALVLLSSYVIAFIYFTQVDFEQFSKSLFSTSLFSSNIFFMRQTANYFAVDSAYKPLLHTWSLAVEEQFYLLYPALLVFFLRATKLRVAHSVAALLLVSFTISCIWVWNAPQAAFYLLPSRAWELLSGALVSLCPVVVLRRQIRDLVVGMGFVCIVISVFMLTSQSLFPGVNALLPCIGTSLILWLNVDETYVGRLLTWRYAVFIGLISYSLYLWHWPVVIFWKYLVNEQMDWLGASVIICASLVLAALSWKFVEQPVRRRNSRIGRGQVVFGTASAIAVFAGLGAFGVISNGFPQRLPAQVLRYASGKLDGNPRQRECIERSPERVLRGDFCVVGSRDTPKPDFLVWGDSYTDAWMPIFDAMARAEHLTGWFAGYESCLPLLHVKQMPFSTSDRCQEFTDFVAKAALDNNIRDVVLISNWSWYIYGYESVQEVRLRAPVIDAVGSGDTGTDAVAAKQRVFARGVQQTLEFLGKNHVRAWIVDEVAGQLMDVPTYLARNASSGRPSEGRLRAEVMARQEFIRTVFSRSESKLVVRIDPDTILCPAREIRCHIESEGHSLYRDSGHLSVFGAHRLSLIFVPMFKAIASSREN